MKISSHNASAMLYEKAKSLGRDNHDSWRCIYLNMSDRPARYNDSLHRHFVVKALEDLLEDLDGHVYICEDGDIFILFQWAIRPIVRRLGSHFSELAPMPFTQDPGDNTFSIFDLSRHWGVFFRLCQAKYCLLTIGLGEMPAHLQVRVAQPAEVKH